MNKMIDKDIKIGIQGGIIVLVKQTYLNDRIYINGITE